MLVDQFEEIFTYAEAGGRQAADESDAFVSLLLAARDAAKADVKQPGLHVALTMRTDFLGNCVRFADLPEAINQAQYLTPRLKRDEIERAIRGPAELWGGQIDDSLVAELINATGQSADQLPLVRHALARMWDEARRRQPTAPQVDWPVADAIGGVAGAVAKHAQEIWDTLNPVEQFIVTGIFSAITERRAADAGGQAVRRPQTLARIASWLGRPSAELKPLVERYAAADVCFLQFRAPLADDSIVDISHEAVIRQWPALSTWVDLEAERAAALLEYHRKARLYRGGQTSLLSGADLVRACEWSSCGVLRKEGQEVGEMDGWWPRAAWAQRYLGDAPFTSDEAATLVEDVRTSADPLVIASARLEGLKAYIWDSQQAIEQAQCAEAERLEREASYQRQLAEAAQTQATRARRQTVFFAVFGVLAFALALFSGWAWERANESTTAAKAALREATARRLVTTVEAVASGRKSGDMMIARWQALSAYRMFDHSECQALLQLLAGNPQVRTLDAGSPIYLQIAFSPDGNQIAAGTVAGEVRLWDAHTGQPIGQPIKGHEGTVYSVAFSPDGQRLASASEDKTLRLWDARTGQPIGQPIKVHEGPVRSVAFSPDGLWVATVSDDRRLLIHLSPGGWVEHGCSKLWRNMSPEEWDTYVGKAVDYVVQCPKLPVPKRGEFPVAEQAAAAGR
ncbi:MAG: hypothetical protein RIQ60_1800 [Pseudomonadota bacterium]